MATTTAYVLVRTGGQYSDWYHNNLYVFLTKEEGEKFISDSNALHHKFRQYCFDYDNWDGSENYYEWNMLNGIKEPISGENWSKRYAWAKQKELDRLTDLVQSQDYNLHEFERIELMKNNFSNPHEVFSDAEIEEVEIREGTQLWRILNEQQAGNG